MLLDANIPMVVLARSSCQAGVGLSCWFKGRVPQGGVSILVGHHIQVPGGLAHELVLLGVEAVACVVNLFKEGVECFLITDGDGAGTAVLAKLSGFPVFRSVVVFEADIESTIVPGCDGDAVKVSAGNTVQIVRTIEPDG